MHGGRELPVADGVRQWVAMTRATQQRDAHLYIIGNGGSAGMASHMATDAAKNGRLRALAFNDSSLLTATGNDLAYDQVFSLPLERLARSGDLLIAISSSGNSPNIVRALEVARGLGVGSRDPDRHARRQQGARARRPQLLRAASPLLAGRNRPIRSCSTTGSISTQDVHGPGAI